MNFKTFLLLSITALFSCGNPIKNEDANVIVEAGTEVDSSNWETSDEGLDEEISVEEDTTEQAIEAKELDSLDFVSFESDVIDTSSKEFWVGYFKPHEDYGWDKSVYADEGLYWNRQNKISISIDDIRGDSIFGHSVVAGNDRPFQGIRKLIVDKTWFIVREPGDDKYDGIFKFRILKFYTGESNQKRDVNDMILKGEWEAYKHIDVSKRSFELTKKTYRYNPDQKLEKDSYADWNKYIETEVKDVINEGTPEEQEELLWIDKEFATTSGKIWEVNASNTLLLKEDVENLSSSDLLIIRNAIYARHGYSFKYRPLRVFFDRQSWYIPVHTDIRKEFTEIEKKNIKLLLKYEKNAKTYYDRFGRG